MFVSNKMLLLKLLHMETQMAVNFDALKAQLAKNTDVVNSAKALVQKLLAEIETIATSADAPTQAALDDLTTQFAAETDDLAGAVAAGTAADPAGQPTGQSKPIDSNAPTNTAPAGGSQ